MKKLWLFLSLLALVSPLATFSQDIIFRKDGSKEEVKIILVGDREIQYKKFNNPDGPVYATDRREILLITYENGDFDVINKILEEEKPVKADLTRNFARNIIHYHMFDLVFGDFAFSYERILSNGQIGIKIPVSVGYDFYSDIYDFNSVFYSGVGVNFYPTGQGKWRYFVGPQARVGLGKQTDWVYYYDDNGNYLYDEAVEDEGIYTRFFVDNGVMFTPVRNFSISAAASVGIRYFPEASYNEDVIHPDGWFAFNIGYRF